jgi:hypothetical protein
VSRAITDGADGLYLALSVELDEAASSGPETVLTASVETHDEHDVDRLLQERL